MTTDRELYRAVVEELGCDGHLGGIDVAVSVEDGVVTLRGEVGSVAQLVAAEQAVQRIEGVTRINLHVAVKHVDRTAPEAAGNE